MDFESMGFQTDGDGSIVKIVAQDQHALLPECAYMVGIILAKGQTKMRVVATLSFDGFPIYIAVCQDHFDQTESGYEQAIQAAGEIAAEMTGIPHGANVPELTAAIATLKRAKANGTPLEVAYEDRSDTPRRPKHYLN